MDVVKVTVWIPDQAALRKVLSAAQVHVECGAPRLDKDGFALVVYTTKAESLKIAALGFKHEIDEKFGDFLMQRRAEVSKVDRFQGGTIKPVGLGVKR